VVFSDLQSTENQLHPVAD